ncbi:outer membrane beta-barrel protein [Thalassotalea sp. HSM 43]|uniref:outer membrane beta-barrel protein n=1 Tax=Thalassotalea sp. HSM 43 TaxID=2552945 RepID=UPI0016768DC3|nr:outer membrane beta-barrel protein [Thalassotalea sp. HSM 43]
MRFFVAISLCLATINIVNASPVSWDYVQLEYVAGESENSELDMDGVAIEASYSFMSNVFVSGQYETAEFDKFKQETSASEYQQYQLNLGYYYELFEDNVFYGTLGLIDVEYEKSSFSDSADGMQASIGLRSLFNKYIEVRFYYTYRDLEFDRFSNTASNQWTYISPNVHVDKNVTGIQGFFHLKNNLSIGASLEENDDGDRYALSVRYNF